MGWRRATKKKRTSLAAEPSRVQQKLHRVPEKAEVSEFARGEALTEQTATSEILRAIASSLRFNQRDRSRTRLLLSALTALLLALCSPVESQQPRKIPRIGYLSPGDAVSRVYRTDAFRQGLKDLGYVEGHNIFIEYRFADAIPERLPELARELVALKVDIIFAGGTPATQAAKAATETIPIVTTSQDPISTGLVTGLPRPGGNITGLTNLTSELVGKRLELLKEVVPQLSRVTVVWMPGPPESPTWRRIEVAAQSLGVQLKAAEVTRRDDLEPVLAAMKEYRPQALFMIRSPIVNALTKRIADLALKSRLPTIYDERRFTQLGGLMSYGTDLADVDRCAAIYIDKILKGARPADLPIERPTKFELVINLRTAKALGINIPAHLLMEAERVIE